MYSFKLWDKTTPINGVAADEVKLIHKLKDETPVGIIYDETGKISVLQYDIWRPQTEDELLAQLEEMANAMNNPPLIQGESVDAAE